MVKIKEIMRKYVLTVGPNFSVAEAARVMKNNKVGSVIIVDKGKPVSILTADDITAIVADNKSPKQTKLKSLPNKKLITASPEDDVLRVTKTMIKKGIKRMPVMDGGKLVGIVSDKEILISAPEMMELLSERLKARMEPTFLLKSGQELSGLCERCENYSDDLKNVGGEWLCEDCR